MVFFYIDIFLFFWFFLYIYVWMLLLGKFVKNGGGLFGGESDEDDVEYFDYVCLCSGGGILSIVIYRNLYGILYYFFDF